MLADPSARLPARPTSEGSRDVAWRCCMRHLAAGDREGVLARAVAALGGGADRGELEGYLNGLERQQFVGRECDSSVPGETRYTFAHVLVRDVAYGQIPRAARAGKHAAAAAWIESLGWAEDHAEMLAHHYLAALDLARSAGQDTAGLARRAGRTWRLIEIGDGQVSGRPSTTSPVTLVTAALAR